MEAVVSVSYGALGPLLGKLNTLLADECARLAGVRREIRSLTSELSHMQAALHKYASLEDPDIQVKAWIAELRELAYDIEDCIDKFMHQFGPNDQQHGTSSGIKDFFRRSRQRLKTLGSRHKIAGEIEELMARVISVKDQKNNYKIDDGSKNITINASVDPRLAALFAEENHLVGIEGPRDELVNWMDAESRSMKHRKVLSIVGFGGLGKTTLANEVYRRVKVHFDYHAFISVSQKPDMKKIFKDVIYQMPTKDGFLKDIETWDERKFVAKLRELLVDKRYLVSIDDVWSVSTWDAIKVAFPENDCSSIIIVTTRISDVGRSCCLNGIDRNYEMQPLSEVHSRRLFCKRIFRTVDGCPDSLQEVSRDIMKKCGGLPLAIISISGLLANRPVIKEEWEKVKASIGFALEKNQNLEGMKSILSLSYNDLPNYLKTCLLYLSIFPEDYIIERDMLVWRWIAEGFISEYRGQSMEGVAESYFYELINKSLVQPVDIGYDGKARACRVHDIMLELISSKATEENFITLLDCPTRKTDSHGYVRRLSIQDTDNHLSTLLANKDLRHVRSLTFFGKNINFLPQLARFDALRVLGIQDTVDSEQYDLENIGKLFQLKYLRLCVWKLSRIPAQIANLQNLLTLDLRNTSVQDLPTEFCRLTKLLHLLGPYEDSLKLPDGIGNMKNLQVLTGIDISHSSASAVAELGELTSLRDLTIRLSYEPSECKPTEEMLLASLCKLGNYKLQSLWIRGGGSYEFLDRWSPQPSFLRSFRMSTSYYCPLFPNWIKPSLINIAYLNINLGEIKQEDLKTLGDLPALLCLEIWLEPDPKEQLTVRTTSFPCLKEFVLVCSTYNGGAYLTFEKGAMPMLEKLKLPFHVLMAKSHGFYFGINNLRCLKEAEVGIYGVGAEDSDTEAAVAAILSEANANPNHPRIAISRAYVEENNSEESVDDEDAEDEQGSVTEN